MRLLRVEQTTLRRLEKRDTDKEINTVEINLHPKTRMVMHVRAIGSVLVVLAMGLAACSPSLSPLYRDYEAPSDGEPVDQRITAALAEAGWDTVQVDVPNAITTETKTLSHWGLYKVTARLEVTPLGQDHVRVFVHPYRDFITGGKGKIPYLTPRLRSKFLGPLNEAFEAHGLSVVGTPVERDEKLTNR